jgi:hypothetical protein
LETIKGISTKDADEVEALRPALGLSDQLTDELLASDLLIIASPMWNFGMPSQLKAWIDHIVRPGRTFQYAGMHVHRRWQLLLGIGVVDAKDKESKLLRLREPVPFLEEVQHVLCAYHEYVDH